jgi:MSHA pilin protein MshD
MCIERNGLRAQRGLTLIELVVFIVVISVGLAGILGVLSLVNRDTVNPMLLKQQVAIAESLLEEVQSKPFTFCDPDDANVETALNSAGCASLPPAAAESRYDPASPFDNVGDYDGFKMDEGILLPTDATIRVSGLEAYSAEVAISQAGTAMGLAENGDALRIDVTVGAPSMPDLTLTGYRFRYAPNSP